MKGFGRMKEMKKALKICLFGMLAHICASMGLAATSESEDFTVDLSGMGPWEMRTAAASEAISYSTAWATNLTAAQQASANAVVKVYPAKREKSQNSPSVREACPCWSVVHHSVSSDLWSRRNGTMPMNVMPLSSCQGFS